MLNARAEAARATEVEEHLLGCDACLHVAVEAEALLTALRLIPAREPAVACSLFIVQDAGGSRRFI